MAIERQVPMSGEGSISEGFDGNTILIGGTWSGGEKTFDRFSPADLSNHTGTFGAANPGQVEAAYTAAADAAPGWSGTTATERARILFAIADSLDAHRTDGADRLIADIGKARPDSEAEVGRSAAIFRYFAGELTQPDGETYPSADPSTLLLTREQPVGVVCAITPWNFPFAIPAWKIAPAIAFGNTLVWKPAEAASGSAVFICRLLEAAGLPAGVVNLVTGHGRELSDSLTSDPHLRAITFTGSGGVGTRLRQAVADRNIKVQLELGGKNPAIVLADADLDVAADQVASGAMLSAGQRCTATSRVYIDRPVFEAFRQKLCERVERMTVGDPGNAKTVVGPVASVAQRDTIREYIELARNEGATFLSGNEQPDGDHCFIDPVVLTDVDPESALVREEIFGPVAVLQAVDGLDEAITAANDTEFGLSSTIFTNDLTSALEFVNRTESGLVHVNRETAGVEPHVPFGGIKGSSSQNREQGKAA
ncbi:MAG: aldehyde dehydrogenase family protein, partial [Actinomycetota bacterium]|nr:aldehyde dehydrogenase family protein [Actinomycetota bacterium]